jgi:hypothetical protein
LQSDTLPPHAAPGGQQPTSPWPVSVMITQVEPAEQQEFGRPTEAQLVVPAGHWKAGVYIRRVKRSLLSSLTVWCAELDMTASRTFEGALTGGHLEIDVTGGQSTREGTGALKTTTMDKETAPPPAGATRICSSHRAIVAKADRQKQRLTKVDNAENMTGCSILQHGSSSASLWKAF